MRLSAASRSPYSGGLVGALVGPIDSNADVGFVVDRIGAIGVGVLAGTEIGLIIGIFVGVGWESPIGGLTSYTFSSPCFVVPPPYFLANCASRP